MVRVKVNSKQLERAFADMLKRTTDDEIGRVLQKGAEPIRDQAKINVHVISGDLRDSLAVGNWFRKGGKITVRVGTNLIYSAMEEFGGIIQVTPKMRAYLHYIGIHLRASTTTIQRDPHPYLRPAFQQRKGTAVKEIARELLRMIIG